MVLRWLGEPVNGRGIVERQFRLGPAPGTVWLPAEVDEPCPLVLIGHGGSGHRRTARQLRLAEWFAGVAGIAVAAIDGPYHGERVPEPVDSVVDQVAEAVDAAAYQERMAAAGVANVVDGMVADWQATLAAVGELDAVDSERVAYLGFSMGTRFGLPFVAAAGSRLRCAVLGKYGMRQPVGWPAGVDMASRFARDAPAVGVPVLFHVQWDDEVFERSGQLELFDLLGSGDKQLVAFPGGHRGASDAAVGTWCGYVRDRLRAC